MDALAIGLCTRVYVHEIARVSTRSQVLYIYTYYDGSTLDGGKLNMIEGGGRDKRYLVWRISVFERA